MLLRLLYLLNSGHVGKDTSADDSAAQDAVPEDAVPEDAAIENAEPELDSGEASAWAEPLSVGYVPVTELEEKIPALDLSALPSVSNWTNLAYGSTGSMVQQLQTELIAKGFLDGAADGDFGSGTQAAVNAYLESIGLAQTGIVDAAAWLMLQGEDTALLERFLDPAWKLPYDSFEETGVIRKTLASDIYSDHSRAVDRISMDLAAALYLQPGEDGMLEAVPTLLISSVGAYRPYIQSAVLSCDGENTELSVLAVESAINGSDVTEAVYLELTPEAAECIAQMEHCAIRLSLH